MEINQLKRHGILTVPEGHRNAWYNNTWYFMYQYYWQIISNIAIVISHLLKLRYYIFIVRTCSYNPFDLFNKLCSKHFYSYDMVMKFNIHYFCYCFFLSWILVNLFIARCTYIYGSVILFNSLHYHICRENSLCMNIVRITS